MKRIIAIILVAAVSLSVLAMPASALNMMDQESILRIMPVGFLYTKTITLSPNSAFPPGCANFEVSITGTYDINRDIVIQISSSSCSYRGGINCTGHDIHVVAWRSTTSPNVVCWKLTGTITISWTSPITGMQYETVSVASETFSFNASYFL